MSVRTFFATVLVLLLATRAPAEPLLLCGWDKVFLLETAVAAQGKGDRLWTWEAA